MKKLLFAVLIILLVILTYYAVDKGITIGKINILSISQIQEKNDALDAKIEEANKTIDTEYPNKMSSLKTASNKLSQAKKEYLDLTNLSTNDQIIKATLEESYAIELLWAKIGNYARNKGVDINMSVVSSNTGTRGLYNLNFTVRGTYLSIVNFIESIENDSVLNLRIKNFKLLPSEGSILQATFTVNNIAIEGNTSNQSVTTNNNNNNNTNNNNKD
ncbi:MAG: hypothetical protein J6A29_01190, partial [Clostridia bacterium]|nr:hypothetical protein [Clostridia bacterium]